MNFAGTDYAMGHILRFARQTGHDTLRINLVTGEAEPPKLLAPLITELPVRYTQMFWYLVDRSRAACIEAQQKPGILHERTSQARPAQVAPQFQESPYTCDVTLIDVRGNEYLTHFEGWWFPEDMHHTDHQVTIKLRLWSRLAHDAPAQNPIQSTALRIFPTSGR